jgi:tetratricopeptide (TPR) repeat protein
VFARFFCWVLAITSLVAALRLVLADKASAATMLTLLVIASAAGFLAIGGIEVIRRIHRIGPGGIEIETWQDIDRILSISEHPPTPRLSFSNTQGPWLRARLEYNQSWFYERGTAIILHLLHRGIDIQSLPHKELEKYRTLVLWVGSASLNVNPYKALDILKLLEPIKDKYRDELMALGHAYVLVAQRRQAGEEKVDLLENGKRVCRAAFSLDQLEPETLWLLGWIYDELGLYDESIKLNQEVINLRPEWVPWANWVMAVSYLKKKDPRMSLWQLDKIPDGVWWEQIYQDPELESLRGNPKFEQYRSRNTKGRATI